MGHRGYLTAGWFSLATNLAIGTTHTDCILEWKRSGFEGGCGSGPGLEEAETSPHLYREFDSSYEDFR